MKKILFVCHGNICRSPMAEFVMKDLSRKAGLEEALRIASAATSTEEIGNPVYRRPGASWRSTDQLRRKDGTPAPAGGLSEYDFLVGMDHANLCNMRRMLGGDPEGKLSLLLDTPGVRGRDRRSLVYWGL